MACKSARKIQAQAENKMAEAVWPKEKEAVGVKTVETLIFGVDSKIQSDDLLQNNLTEFEWAVRNKVYPSFWGRNIVGENALTREEIEFLHRKGCKIAAIYSTTGEKLTEKQGQLMAKEIDVIALELGIPEGTAIFLEIGEKDTVTSDFMLGFADMLIDEGYIPGFKANTDAAFDFDREYSRGMQNNRESFEKCLIWAVAPSLKEYDRVTTTHLIHPDNWKPFAPSGITRNEIAIWQYGKDCHPIEDDDGKEATFNINLVRNENIIIKNMF